MDRFFEPTNLPQVLFRSLRSAVFCAWELLLVVPEIILESVLEVSTSGVVYFHDPTFLPGKLQRDSEDSYLHFSTNSAQHAQKQIKPGAVLLSQRCLSQATKATKKVSLASEHQKIKSEHLVDQNVMNAEWINSIVCYPMWQSTSNVWDTDKSDE